MWRYMIQLPDLKICCHILFEMLGSDLNSDCRDLRYLRYFDLKKLRKSVDEILVPLITSVALLVKGCIFGYESFT